MACLGMSAQLSLSVAQRSASLVLFRFFCASLFCLAVASVSVSGSSLNGSTIQSALASGCPGESPQLVNGTEAPCWRGYWLINGTVELNATRYNIEGRIHVWGNFTLPSDSSLSWKGFAKEDDSHPEFQTTGDFILSHVNVTGEVVADGDIFVDVSPENIKKIVGDVKEDELKRKVTQPILESSNPVTINLIASNGVSDECRKVSVGTEATTTSEGRSSLSAVFQIDDSDCGKKKNNSSKIAAIVAPSVIGGFILIVGLIVFLSYKSDRFKAIFRPYHKRKIANRDSVVLRDTMSRNSVVPDVETGQLEESS